MKLKNPNLNSIKSDVLLKSDWQTLTVTRTVRETVTLNREEWEQVKDHEGLSLDYIMRCGVVTSDEGPWIAAEAET